MITKEIFFGGATERSISADVQLTAGSLRCQFIDASAGTFSIILPDATQLKAGGPIFYIFNVDGVDSFDIEDNDNNVIETIVAGDVAILYLFDNSTTAGNWGIRTSTFSSA